PSSPLFPYTTLFRSFHKVVVVLRAIWRVMSLGAPANGLSYGRALATDAQGDAMIGPNTGTPSRKPIILIGAPSGAGKTVLSEQIIAGALPVFAQLCPSIQDGTPVCYDLKLLPQDPPRD